MKRRDEVITPCRKICRISPVHGLCVGCWRNLQEIAQWGSLDDSTRRAVMTRLDERRRIFEPLDGEGDRELGDYYR